MTTEGTFYSMKNEDQNLPPGISEDWNTPITNTFLLATYSPTQLNNTIASPDKDQENAVETTQSAKSGYPLEKR